MSSIDLRLWKAILKRVERELPAEYWHHEGSRTHKAIHRFGKRLWEDVKGEAPVRYGTLRDAHRYVTRRGENTTRGGSTTVSIVIDPRASGPTGRPFIYGPKVAKHNPWMQRAADAYLGNHMEQLTQEIIEAWKVWL